MPITMNTIGKLLKIKYASQVEAQANTNVSAWHELIKLNGLTAGGKYYIQPIELGLNGGVGLSNEVDLPNASDPILDEFKVETKNLFGVFGITKKVLKTNQTPEKVVNLLTNSMNSLVTSLRWNLSRSLEMDHMGVLAKVAGAVNSASTVTLDDVQYLMPGLVISFYTSDGAYTDSAKVINVERSTNSITLSKAVSVSENSMVTIYKSYGMELTGLNDIFSKTGTVYGLDKSKYNILVPTINTVPEISDSVILDCINDCEDYHNVKINYIRMSPDVEKAYLAYKQKNNLNVASMEIKGGYNEMSFNGKIPMVKSKFAPKGTLDCLDSTKFQMYKLGEGEFDDETGSILTRESGQASYTGLYTMFAEQYCRTPGGMGRIKITA